jgi:predicted CopG family antitoxin
MVKTIRLDDELHSRLEALGSKADTFEDIIRKLVEFYESKKK